MSKGYNSKKSARAYTPCCYSPSNIKIHDGNLNGNGQYIISPDDISIDTKNYYFEKFHNDNYLLTSVRYALRVCIPTQSNSYGNSGSNGNNNGNNNNNGSGGNISGSSGGSSSGGLYVRLELVDDRTNQEVTCVKRERAGKRVLKGKTREEFDLSKHGNLKAKLDFRFRETSSDNIVEWFRLNVHIMVDNQKLLTFTSEPFRTSVRSPTKKTTRLPPPPLNPTIIQLTSAAAAASSSIQDEDSMMNTMDDDNDESDDSGNDDDDENDDDSMEFNNSPPKKSKQSTSHHHTNVHQQSSTNASLGQSLFPFLPPYQQQPPPPPPSTRQ